jgi:hypothetical protein
MYKSIVERNKFVDIDLIEAIQLSMFAIEMSRGGPANPIVGSTISALSMYADLLAGDLPSRKRPLAKHELLYLVAKVDSILNRRETLNGCVLFPPSPTESVLSDLKKKKEKGELSEFPCFCKNKRPKSPPPGWYI